MDDVRIGDFSKPVTQPPAPAPRQPARPPAGPDEATLGAEADAIEAGLQPLRSYEDQLRAAGVSPENAASMVDSIMEKGFWSEPVKITRTVSARFRTRTARDRTRAMERVEVARPAFDAHYYDMTNKLLLAASLESFGKAKFEHPAPGAKPEEVERAFETRYAYVDAAMAEPAYLILLRAFLKFEDKVRVVTTEGVVENF